MSGEWYDGAALPVLLRAARRAYGSAVRAGLAEIGCEDVPRNGAFLIGGIAKAGAPLRDVIQQLGASKQAAGALVDTLVARGYLDRQVDPEDRRRLTVTLTERGVSAAVAIRSAVEGVDDQLEGRIGVDRVVHARAVLSALIDIGEPS